ncbi:RteC domain-containing protein [Flavobacterium sp. PLA-1-15]|uniref:RteC domain-containing protein n=1 Tax=Flavobacterium sp. PLA-1-15 TaxID=3380533 RepID=UPI003B7AE0E7
MKPYSQSLLMELEQELEQIHRAHIEPISYSEKAIKMLEAKIDKLKAYLAGYTFTTKQEEIEFFKTIKPQFASRLIYYHEIFNIEHNRPCGSGKIIRKYYRAELEKLKTFFDQNLEFYKYYRMDNNYLDNRYFLRGEHDIRLTLDVFYYQTDQQFSTSHDCKVAKILANDLIKIYLEYELAKLEGVAPPAQINANTSKKPKWTAPKVSLIELIYALHTEGVFNNGTSELKEIASYMETVFEVRLGNYYRTYIEIRARKSERTRFLDALRQGLTQRMDDADYGPARG